MWFGSYSLLISRGISHLKKVKIVVWITIAVINCPLLDDGAKVHGSNHPHTPINAHNSYKITYYPYTWTSLHVSAINRHSKGDIKPRIKIAVHEERET